LKCLRLLGGLSRASPDGAPSLPFYRPREGPGVHKREKEEKKKEKNREEGSPRVASHFSSHRQIMPVLQTTMEARARRHPVRHWCYRQALSPNHGVPSRPGMRYGQQTPLTGVARGFKQHSASPPGAIGDVNAQVWPVVAAGHIGARPSPP
jgi:hypothetical protein